MNQMDAKAIFLKWLDRILNPNLEKKLIWGLFALGSALIGTPIIGRLIKVGFSSELFDIQVAVGEDSGGIFSAISISVGVIFVIGSLVLFLRSGNEAPKPQDQQIDVSKPIGPVEFFLNSEVALTEEELNDVHFVYIDYANEKYPYRQKFLFIVTSDIENPIWGEYIEEFPIEIRPYIARIRTHVHENNWDNRSGESMNGTIFAFADGVNIWFNWKSWGNLIQAIKGLREGYQKYEYG
jgi:hypothetical protein